MQAESNAAVVLYREHGLDLPCRIDGGHAWVTAEQGASLYGIARRTFEEHAEAILAEGELPANCRRKFRQQVAHGPSTRFVEVWHFNQDMVLHVGYRVRSERGAEFRRWATAVVKGDAPALVPANQELRIHPEDIERMGNAAGSAAARALAPAMTAIRDEQRRQAEELSRLRGDVDGLKESNLRWLDAKRKNPSKITVQRHLDFLHSVGGKCPCCHTEQLFYEGRFVGHIDHNFKVCDASLIGTWPTCPQCNERLKTPAFREERQAEFKTYQRMLQAYAGPLFAK